MQATIKAKRLCCKLYLNKEAILHLPDLPHIRISYRVTRVDTAYLPAAIVAKAGMWFQLLYCN
jgi:hypothetical protein